MSLINASGHNMTKVLVRRGTFSGLSTPPFATVMQSNAYSNGVHNKTHTYSITAKNVEHLKDATWRLSYEAWTLSRKAAVHQEKATKLANDAEALGDEAKELNTLAKNIEDKLENFERGVIYALSSEAKEGREHGPRNNDKRGHGHGAMEHRPYKYTGVRGNGNDAINDFEDEKVGPCGYAGWERRMDYGSS